MLTYAVPDIHGRFDLLALALDLIQTHAATRQHQVIFLGDYIDRGPQSAQVVGCIRAGQREGRPWIALKGNHEDFMVAAVLESDAWMTASWVGNGGAETMASYDQAGSDPESDARWMQGLPAYFEDRHRVYVHAFAPEQYRLEDAPEHILLWSRYPERADVGYRGKHVVHGHTPKLDGPELYPNRTNLDCGAVFGGRLVVGVFDATVAGGPIDTISADPVGKEG